MNQFDPMSDIFQSIPQAVRAMIAILLCASGNFVALLWTRTLKTRKGIVGEVTKTVTTVARVGIAHDNRAAVQEARDNGELPAVNGGLPWGQWLLFPYLIGHKGRTYARIYPIKRNRALRVTYRLNGKLIDRKTAQDLCLASEFSKVNDEVGCITLGVDNLRRVKLGPKIANA